MGVGLRALARLSGITNTGSVEVQYADLTWSFPGHARTKVYSLENQVEALRRSKNGHGFAVESKDEGTRLVR
ncbi:hypothetical protein PILCRDRAFT_820625 [Piloderma croceum F 1598]|uniref:Uncharacterized protein n=1 Tax=Piloderma croceum (strain F 1598) TaxID=765440 RepID=A0A0C3B207_PILCF|nr:hypothetical protein PILCRDRAFT_830460 [Piloderma croceum F 1598]KIM82240.1 hypothetical protein PILCRDRAFT_820625 [Piloderma croceum F 1598]